MGGAATRGYVTSPTKSSPSPATPRVHPTISNARPESFARSRWAGHFRAAFFGDNAAALIGSIDSAVGWATLASRKTNAFLQRLKLAQTVGARDMILLGARPRDPTFESGSKAVAPWHGRPATTSRRLEASCCWRTLIRACPGLMTEARGQGCVHACPGCSDGRASFECRCSHWTKIRSAPTVNGLSARY